MYKRQGLTALSLEKDEVKGEVRENLEQINNSGMYLLNLINDTLDMSRIEEKKIKLQEEPFRLQAVIDSVEHQISVMEMCIRDSSLCAYWSAFKLSAKIVLMQRISLSALIWTNCPTVSCIFCV